MTKSLHKDLINYYSTPGDLLNLIKFSKSANLNLDTTNLKEFITCSINNGHYKKHKFISDNLSKFLEVYFLNLLSSAKDSKNIYLIYRNFINKFNNIKKYNLDEESFYIELKSKVFNE